MLGYKCMEAIHAQQHYISPLDGNGWKQPSPSLLVVDWDSDENSARVRETVALLKKGCGCKTGCQSYRCKCKKGGNYCFGCKCVGCCNLPEKSTNIIITTPNTDNTEIQYLTEESESELESDEELEREVEEDENTDTESICDAPMDII